MTQETDLTNEGNPIEVTPTTSPEDIGLASISTAAPSPSEAVIAPISAMDQQINSLKEEFKELLLATEHDLLEAYEWLKRKLL